MTMKDNQYFRQLCKNSCYYCKIFIFIANYSITMAKSLEKGSSLHPPPPHRRGEHLPGFAEAAAGPEGVVLVLVTAPVLIGSGASASAVLREGGGCIDLVGKEKKGSPRRPVQLFREGVRSRLMAEDL